MSTAQLAAGSYLARYSGRTHALYEYQLRAWFSWCQVHGLDPLVAVQRAHVELYIRHLGDRGLMDPSVVTMMHGVRGFFRFAHIDGLIPSDPALRGHRVLHLVGKGNKPATMPITVPVLRVLEACRGESTFAGAPDDDHSSHHPRLCRRAHKRAYPPPVGGRKRSLLPIRGRAEVGGARVVVLWVEALPARSR
jgi:hypothetical protein